MDRHTEDLIRMLARHEDALTELYGCYAIIFPYWQDFWTSLARDEATHAAFLRVLRRYADEGVDITSETELTPESVSSWLGFIEQQMDCVRVENVHIEQALSVALDIEQVLIEKRAFASFQSDDIRVLRVIHKLENDTQGHRSHLQNAMNTLAVAA